MATTWGDPRAGGPRTAARDTPCTATSCASGSTCVLGWGRVLSYGSLYPALKKMLAPAGSPSTSRTDAPRAAVVAGGSASSTSSPRPATSGSPALMTDAGPSAWEDDNFDVRFAFFGRTDPRSGCGSSRVGAPGSRSGSSGSSTSSRAPERGRPLHPELQRHGLESVEREVRWLSELIDAERAGAAPPATGDRRHHTRPAAVTSNATERRKENPMGSVRVAIVGVGNCATSLIQGVEYYQDADPDGRPGPDAREVR